MIGYLTATQYALLRRQGYLRTEGKPHPSGMIELPFSILPGRITYVPSHNLNDGADSATDVE